MTCPRCNGSGTMSPNCLGCGGSGYRNGLKCSRCGGSGRTPMTCTTCKGKGTI